MSWRTEPEIGEEQQRALAERRATMPDVVTGRYAFKDVELGRADIEWLLATHDGGRGPVDWDDQEQRSRVGLDLRGAIIRNDDLSGLPLARTVGGLSTLEGLVVQQVAGPSLPQVWEDAAAHFIDVHASDLDLRGSTFSDASFEDVQFLDCHLECSFLLRAQFTHAELRNSHFEGAQLLLASFDQVFAEEAHFEGAHLQGVRATRASFDPSYFEGADCV